MASHRLSRALSSLDLGSNFFVKEHLSPVLDEIGFTDVHRFFPDEMKMVQSEFIKFVFHPPNIGCLDLKDGSSRENTFSAK